ncbi:MAG: tripartite tricarboxylate transporter substrate binding protein [Burkholderiales bacterium]|nr:tripartite tricarboxylate transporter substrate binding protein [Burkholderiales bacterium]
MALCRLAGLAVLSLAVALPAAAQGYPKGPVKWIVPFPPGGPTDVVGRIVAQQLQEAWGQPVVVENKPGAGTMIGTDAVAKSAPDGQTIGMVITAYMINPSLNAATIPYDTLKDLAQVTQLVRQHLVLVANPSTPFGTAKDLIAYARANPGKLTYASPGTGTSAHLAGELLCKEAGIEMRHIPYKGSGPALADLVAGRVDLMFDVYHSARGQVEQGKLKIIALTSETQPANIKGLPLLADTVRGFNVTSLFGLVVRAGTPKAVVDRIQADTARILQKPDVKARLEGMGLEVVGSTPEQFEAFVRAEMAKWARLIKEANIRIE